MKNLAINPYSEQDLPQLARIDHSFHTDFVWQMEIIPDEKEIGIRFKEVRLPRSMRVEYPRSRDNLKEEIEDGAITLVAHLDDEAIGYVTVSIGSSNTLGIINDIAILRRVRRRGVGTSLIHAVQAWLSQKGINQVQLEMQSKNYPAICLATSLGFEFCGYSDRYYSNKDIALFFGKRI